MKKAHVTHPELKCTFCLDILGVKKNPNGASYTQLGVVTKGTIIEVRGLCCWPGGLHWVWTCCNFPLRCCAGERERAGPGHARRQGRVGQVRAGEEGLRHFVIASLHLHPSMSLLLGASTALQHVYKGFGCGGRVPLSPAALGLQAIAEQLSASAHGRIAL